MGGTGDESLMYGSGVYEYQHRPRRDTYWTYAYIVYVVLIVAFGTYGVVHRNREFDQAFSGSYLSNPGNCPYHGRKLIELTGEELPLDVPEFFKHASIWLVVSSAGSFLLGMAFLLIFKHVPHTMVLVTIVVQIALPAVLGISALFAGQIGSGVIMLVLAGIAALAFYLWRSHIELCARLLGVASVSLNHNPHLVTFALVCKLVLILLVLPMFGLIFFSYTNGSVVPNSARQGRGDCVDEKGQRVSCCMWQPDGWVGPYISFAAVLMLWTIFTVGQLRMFVLSGTVAQWYFAPPGAPEGTKGNTVRSVKHALGPSFGTLTFGAAVLTMVQIARNTLDAARRNRSGGNWQAIFWFVLACILECVNTLIEYLTKFATIMAAITGDDFLDAGRRSTDLLARNFLKSYAVWWFPPLVIQMASFILSAAWGILTFILYYIFSKNRPHGDFEAGILGAINFFVAWVVLSFFGTILLDIVDAVYLCYAIDKDNQTVTKAEVHEIYSQVPVGAAVENPSGDMQYGAPQTQPGSYVPPSHPSAAAQVASNQV